MGGESCVGPNTFIPMSQAPYFLTESHSEERSDAGSGVECVRPSPDSSQGSERH